MAAPFTEADPTEANVVADARTARWTAAGRSWIGPVIVALGLTFALVTFLVLTGFTSIVPTHNVVVSLLVADAILVLALITVVIREIWALRRARKIGTAASRLHERVVRLVMVITTVPVVMLAVTATITIDRGLETIFSGGIERAIDASKDMANAYISEQLNQLRSESGAMVKEIDRVQQTTSFLSDDFKKFLTSQALLRGFVTINLMRQDRTVVQRSEVNFPVIFPLPTPQAMQNVATSDDIVAQFSIRDGQTFLEAVMRLRPNADEFLFLVRPINQQVSRYLDAVRLGLVEYETLRSRRAGVQAAFALMFTLIGLIIILAAVFVGLAFANRLVMPIRRLIDAANQVAGGNLNVAVHIRASEGDLAKLGDTFNTMTRELRTQQADLVSARDQIDSRRRFTEAVLSGVTLGIVGIDDAGIVTLFNPKAIDILEVAPAALSNASLAKVIPELADVLKEAEDGTASLVERHITLIRDAEERTIVVRVASERIHEGERPAEHGLVVTLDDITDLVVAQRSSAWADVARRIAHEIKNPLTPIQLSAERLKRKYGRVIVEDREIFDHCTDTIIRQVGDIGRMVDEFSTFARMPKAQFGSDDVAETLRQAVFLMRVGHPEIAFTTAIPDETFPAKFDRRLISQALTNIIKNATEAIAALPEEDKEPGKIHVSLTRNDSMLVIDVMDNGIGLPKQNRSRLLEPYVTTREKGTGLGLAIVGKVLEEHGGGLELLDAPPNEAGRSGALVRMSFLAIAEEKSEQVEAKMKAGE